MMSSEYTSVVMLRAREEQLQRNAERFRVIKERQAELLAEHGDTAPHEGRRPARTIISRLWAVSR
jgi:hypothetical protein